MNNSETEEVSVILVDDSSEYRWILKSFIVRYGLTVVGSFTHEELLQAELDPAPDVAIITFKRTTEQTFRTVSYVKQKYPAIKILICASFYDRVPVDDIKQMDVEGLIFKADGDPEEIINAIKTVHKNEKYFRR